MISLCRPHNLQCLYVYINTDILDLCDVMSVDVTDDVIHDVTCRIIVAVINALLHVILRHSK